MSEFDKEAEREKLREKYGEDDADREATQRMSQLLLQGATMTNRHCDRCGDPIFRQNGQEFCPTCNVETQPAKDNGNAGDADDRRADPDAQSADVDAQRADADAQSVDAGAPPVDADAESVDASAPPVDAAAQTADTQRTPAQTRQTDADAQPGPAAASGRPELGANPTPPTDDASPSAGSTSASRGTGIADDRSSASAGDLADADAALVRALNQFASAAAQVDDPRRAKENLEAAREAAEALDALRR
ncbi:Sjogren's syndrome/scleroderma autoantigen 1 family protein [Natronoarchaeum rubrum]|uniref:Sjogren's syndrome/scleroderma autoantigen 1 family protein n=1 Tax=Natronoarchaeum rubrum TaxID=755311 RepID=UPI0021120402|nr:Sjogren's syndrome/scleroderma autoantigen 1 family protein [Natronoarchaeum rubrum]